MERVIKVLEAILKNPVPQAIADQDKNIVSTMINETEVKVIRSYLPNDSGEPIQHFSVLVRGVKVWGADSEIYKTETRQKANSLFHKIELKCDEILNCRRQEAKNFFNCNFPD